MNDPGARGEFAFIARHFAPLAGPGGLGLRDDAALIAVEEGRELAVSADTMVEGVHFFADDPPDLIARKLLRCNLSDLAAMGAEPRCYLLSIARPDRLEDAWFAGFARGLRTDQDQYAIALLGGDTTRSTGPLVLSLTIMGVVPQGQALRRSGAGPGDGIWVSGTIGDAALGLFARQGTLADPHGDLIRRYLLPEPRVALGAGLRGVASAAMDVSDGLIQDLGHMASASGVGMEIDATRVPASAAAIDASGRFDGDWLETRLSGGDDYELVLTCPAGREAALVEIAAATGTALTRIGRVTQGSGVIVFDRRGATMPLTRRGWQHF